MKVCELLLEYSGMDYDSKKGHMTGDVKRWLASAEIKTGDKEFFKDALALLKKTDAWKELEKTNLKYVGTERELANGTLSFYDGDFSQYKNVTGNSGRYKIYGNGQIRTDVPTAPTRLKSPKPRMVVGNPMKSMVSTWENSLWELLNKYKKRIKKAGK